MPDDTLLINRQAEVPDLLALGVLTPEQERMGYLSYGDLSLEQRAIVDQQLTALGVGKPEQQVRERDFKRLIIPILRGHSVIIEPQSMPDAADRIERAIGGGHEGT